MSNNRKGLKAWVRYDGNNNAVAGSLIFQKEKPKVGKWKEFHDVNLCCSSTVGCSGNFNWYLHNLYAPALEEGWITFPNHIDAQPNLNPNLIGSGGYELYINLADADANITSYLYLLVGQSGTLTLTQGNKSVTYGFTENSFFTGEYGNNVFYDDIFGYSEGLTLLSPSSGDFNTRDCISIYIQVDNFPITTTTTTTEVLT